MCESQNHCQGQSKLQKNRCGISWHVHISTNPRVVHGHVHVEKMRKPTQEANLPISLWQGRERKDQERMGREVYLYPFISLENGDQKWIWLKKKQKKPENSTWEKHMVPTHLPIAYACWLWFIWDLLKMHLFMSKHKNTFTVYLTYARKYPQAHSWLPPVTSWWRLYFSGLRHFYQVQTQWKECYGFPCCSAGPHWGSAWPWPQGTDGIKDAPQTGQVEHICHVSTQKTETG